MVQLLDDLLLDIRQTDRLCGLVIYGGGGSDAGLRIIIARCQVCHFFPT